MALINMVMFDLTLRTSTLDNPRQFSFNYSSEHTRYVDYGFNLEYELLLGYSELEFLFKYTSNKEFLDTQNEFRLAYRYTTGELRSVDYLFNARYQDEAYFPLDTPNYFTFLYQISPLEYTDTKFSFRYKNEALFLSDEYVFDLRYNLGFIREKDLEFRFRFMDKSFVASSEYVYQLLYAVDAIEVNDNDFIFRYSHEESLPIDREFTLPYQLRYANAENPNNAVPITIPREDGRFDFELNIENVTMSPGNYIAAIDSGSAYSGYFAKFTVPEIVDEDISLSLFSRNGVGIHASFSDTIDTIKFTVEDIDIDSSISISAFGTDAEEYSMMFSEWPSWYSYTHEDETNPPKLVTLDSGTFKILPLQPNTCCLYKSNELCILPPYTEVDEVYDDIDVLKLDWILVNTALWDVSQIGKHCSAGLAEAALVPNRTVSLLTAEIVGPGTLEFDWMLKSTGNDSLWFEIADVFSVNITSAPNVIRESVTIPRGVYMLEWFYIKDETSSDPSDISSIDKITYKRS